MSAWRKLGQVYEGRGEAWWAESHGYLPTPDRPNDGRIMVYCATLCAARIGRVGRFVLDAADPRRILAPLEGPVLDIGPAGSFDDSGVSPTCILDVNDEKYLYYFGWQRTVQVPYMLFGGLAISRDGGATFTRCADSPILDRTAAEPFGRSAPMVLREDGVFKMWYVSVTEWTAWRGSLVPAYDIRYLESDDGRNWPGTGARCVAIQRPEEFGLGRPWVVKDGARYRMWYSIRTLSQPYRIGYAESPDGRTWTRRDDQAGIVTSVAGWDSEMICFPSVVQAGARRYMFYNGNQHGATGFGCATDDAAEVAENDHVG